MLRVNDEDSTLVILEGHDSNVAVARPGLEILSRSLRREVLLIRLLRIDAAVLATIYDFRLAALNMERRLDAMTSTGREGTTGGLTRVCLRDFQVVGKVETATRGSAGSE